MDVTEKQKIFWFSVLATACPIFEVALLKRLHPYLPLMALIACIGTTYAMLQSQLHIFQLPYVWDELGVYSRAAIYLYEHSLSLLPSGIPDELSRGHPTFVAFYVALWFKLFGCQPVVAHIAMAAINTAAFVLVYLILKRYMLSWTAAAAAFMVFLQPFILAQSTLVLPEIPLFFATALALYFYLKDRYWLTCLAMILALQIKESALILPFAFYLTHLIICKRLRQKHKFQLIILPVLSFILFIFIQKIQRDYYFYPLHTSLLTRDAYYLKLRWSEFSDFLFWEQGHYVLLLAWIILLPALHTFKSIKWRQNALVLPVIFLGGVAFSVLNYYLSRYTIFFMVPLYCFIIISVAKPDASFKYAPYLLIIIGTLTALFHLNGGSEFKDTDFSYTNHVNNLQSTVSHLDEPIFKGRTIRMDFPLAACYWGDKNGYKRVADYSITYDKNAYAEFAVYTYPGNMQDTMHLPANARLIKEIKNKEAYSKIYRLLEEKDYQ